MGLVTGACFAAYGNQVTCVDTDQRKIANLQAGILPIYEPGLEEIVHNNLTIGRLKFAASLDDCVDVPQVIFIAVGTPSDETGKVDTTYILSAAQSIGDYLNHYCVIADKSTVPIGMAEEVAAVLVERLNKRGISIFFDVVSNPEFLREGAAIQDFMNPDRVIVGLSSDSAKQIMQDLYLPILRNPERLYFMNIKDAEMTKYVANAMLATRISFMNEMALLCEKMGADIENVRLGIGSDTRIGQAMLHAGCGYGGSCFPKDVRALAKMAEQNGIQPFILEAVQQRNLQQKKILADKIINLFGNDLSRITIGIWGLSFKPETDDMREASSLILIEELLLRGAIVKAYDPQAMPMIRRIIDPVWFQKERLILMDQQYAALENSDALALVTEWKDFCYPDFELMKTLMKRSVIFDGRNQYDPNYMRQIGFAYYPVGRGGFN